jgi:hypothetical protein
MNSVGTSPPFAPLRRRSAAALAAPESWRLRKPWPERSAAGPVPGPPPALSPVPRPRAKPLRRLGSVATRRRPLPFRPISTAGSRFTALWIPKRPRRSIGKGRPGRTKRRPPTGTLPKATGRRPIPVKTRPAVGPVTPARGLFVPLSRRWPPGERPLVPASPLLRPTETWTLDIGQSLAAPFSASLATPLRRPVETRGGTCGPHPARKLLAAPIRRRSPPGGWQIRRCIGCAGRRPFAGPPIARTR